MSLNRDGDDGEEDESRRAETAWSFDMLLDQAALPGHGWSMVEERSWPTGQLDQGSMKSQRALQFGGITAWRSLEQAESRRSVWVEVVPYASAADALTSLGQVSRYFVGTTPNDETIVAEQVVEDRVLPGVADTWMFEKATTRQDTDHQARYVAGTVDRILFLTCVSSQGSTWPWEDVIGLAALQAEAVRQAVGRDRDS